MRCLKLHHTTPHLELQFHLSLGLSNLPAFTTHNDKNPKVTVPFEYNDHFTNDHLCKLQGFMMLQVDVLLVQGHM